MKSCTFRNAAIFAMLVTAGVAPRQALADKEGTAYRGTVHCSDPAMTEMLKRHYDCYVTAHITTFVDIKTPGCEHRATNWEADYPTSGKLVATHKPWGPKPSAWLSTFRLVRRKTASGGSTFVADDTPQLIVTKGGASRAAVNALVCSFEDPPWGKEAAKKLPSVTKESAGRIEHDAAAGATLPLALSNARDKSTLYFVYLESESSMSSVDYKLSLPVVAAAADKAK